MGVLQPTSLGRQVEGRDADEKGRICNGNINFISVLCYLRLSLS